MTVEVTTITAGPFAGNGTVDEFDFEFTIVTDEQIIVFETDDEGAVTTLVLDDDYTVTGVGDEEGGTVTRLAGNLPTGYTWFMRSNYLPTQATAFTSQGAFFPALHEAAMDKLTYLVLQLYDRVSRALRFADSYSGGASTELPTPEANAALTWNADGDAIVNDTTFPAQSAAAVAAAAAATAAAASMLGDYLLTGTVIDAGNGGMQTKTITEITTLTNTLANGEAVALHVIDADLFTFTITGVNWVGLYGETTPTYTGDDWLLLLKSQGTLYGWYSGETI